MHNFKWDESLDVNVDAMNNQHKKLITLMNKLYQLNSAGAPRQDIINGIDELIRYTSQHFAEEEAYMDSIQYGGIAAHKKLHANILENLRAHREEFISSGLLELSAALPAFLNLWLVSHIRGIDTKYGFGL